MLRLITSRELKLYAAQMADMKAEIARLQVQVEHERKRAEGAINALLIKSAKIAITPVEGMSVLQEMEMKEKQYDIFGDGADYSETEALEKLQS